MREAPEHGEHAVAEAERRSDRGAVQAAESLGDAQAGGDLVGAAGGHAPGMEPVLAASAATLAEVQRDGGRGAAELLGQRWIALIQRSQRLAEAASELECDFEGIERHGALLFGWGLPIPAQGP